MKAKAVEPRNGGAREIRCACGSLMARRAPGGIEIKCRRCKRVVLLRWEDIKAEDESDGEEGDRARALVRVDADFRLERGGGPGDGARGRRSGRSNGGRGD
ncbi:MAG: hypothetical protein AB1405_02405 [Bdellovibrionota bacterium]